MSEETIRLGVVGCGSFGLFALQYFAQVPGVQLAGMAGTHLRAVQAVANRFGIHDLQEVEALVQRPDVNLAYIATPPFLHRPQALLALRAGKRAICEKQLAIEATRTASVGANP